MESKVEEVVSAIAEACSVGVKSVWEDYGLKDMLVECFGGPWENADVDAKFGDLFPGADRIADLSAEGVHKLVKRQVEIANGIEKRVNESLAKSRQARRAAREAQLHKTGLFSNTGAIEDLQKALKTIAEAQLAQLEVTTYSTAYTFLLARIVKSLCEIAKGSEKRTQELIVELKEVERQAQGENIELINTLNSVRVQLRAKLAERHYAAEINRLSEEVKELRSTISSRM